MEISTFFDIASFVHKDLFENVLFPWDPLERLEGYLAQYKSSPVLSKIPEGVFVKNPESIFVGDGVVIEPGAYIQGPCIIGDGCEIRHGAYIRGGVILGEQCVVGHASEVKSSLLLNGAKIPHFNYCGDSILGNRTNMGAGSITANVRFDRKAVYAYIEGEKISSGRNKFGLILGDGSQLGCNVVTQPGTVLGKGVMIPPYTYLKGRIAHDCESSNT